MNRTADNINSVRVGTHLNAAEPSGTKLMGRDTALSLSCHNPQRELAQTKQSSFSLGSLCSSLENGLSSLIPQVLSPLVQGQNKVIANNDLDSIFLEP